MADAHNIVKGELIFVMQADDKSAIRVIYCDKAIASIYVSSRNPEWQCIFIYPMPARLLRIIADFMAVLKLPGKETDNGQSKETLQVDL